MATPTYGTLPWTGDTDLLRQMELVNRYSERPSEAYSHYATGQSMSYESVITDIYTERLPNESYIATLRRIYHPLAPYWRESESQCEAFEQAFVNFKKESAASHSEAISGFVKASRGIEVQITLDFWRYVEPHIDVLYAHINPEAKTVRLQVL